jgi:uncharacterized membrane protein YphA (DoxX/SURF4 family)
VDVGRVPQDRNRTARRSVPLDFRRDLLGRFDVVVALLLVLIGASLLLGLFTQTGCTGALVMLSIFYVSAIPLGLSDARAEGSYLIVNKNLIELAAVVTLLVFQTGCIAVSMGGGLVRRRCEQSGASDEARA